MCICFAENAIECSPQNNLLRHLAFEEGAGWRRFDPSIQRAAGRLEPWRPIWERNGPMLRQKQILVIEDNLINREMLKESLSGEYCVLEAENGL